MRLGKKSTTVYVPSSELGPPRPLSHKECAPPPPEPMEGGHTRLRVRGWGSPNSDDWRKSLALCILCVWYYSIYDSSSLGKVDNKCRL
jgi:hypothetical protein